MPDYPSRTARLCRRGALPNHAAPVGNAQGILHSPGSILAECLARLPVSTTHCNSSKSLSLLSRNHFVVGDPLPSRARSEACCATALNSFYSEQAALQSLY